MKKWMLIALVAVLAIGLVVGGIFLFKANKDDEQAVKYSIDYLAEEYVQGDTLVFSVKAYSDKELTSVVYTLDNGAEQTLSVTAGETKDLDDKSATKNGTYYVFTGTETVSLESVAVGEHLIKFYVYEGSTRHELGKAQVFTIVSAN